MPFTLCIKVIKWYQYNIQRETMKSLLIIFTVLMLIGCGEQKVEATGIEAYTESIQIMKKDMSLKEKEEFENHIRLIALQGTNFKMPLDIDVFKRRAMDKLSGLTVKQINTKGKKLAAKYLKAKKEVEKEKILELCSEWVDVIEDNKETISKRRKTNQANESTDLEWFNEYKERTDLLQEKTDGLQKSYDNHCLKYEN